MGDFFRAYGYYLFWVAFAGYMAFALFYDARGSIKEGINSGVEKLPSKEEMFSRKGLIRIGLVVAVAFTVLHLVRSPSMPATADGKLYYAKCIRFSQDIMGGGLFAWIDRAFGGDGLPSDVERKCYVDGSYQ